MTDFSKIGRRSKAKGKDYERRIAEAFTKKTGVSFRRTPNSGGLNAIGGVVVAGRTFCGDLICDNPDFIFSVEAKNRKCFNYTHIIKNLENSDFLKWWFQACRDSARYKLHPFLVFNPESMSRDKIIAICANPWASKINPIMTIPGIGKELTFTVSERSIDEKKTRTHSVKAILPVPMILHWDQFEAEFDPNWMFDKSIIASDLGTVIEYK